MLPPSILLADRFVRRKRKLTADEAFGLAARSLGLAVFQSQTLCHAATADWPPEIPNEIQGAIPPETPKPIKPAREEWDFRVKFRPPADFDCPPYEFLEDAEVLPCHEYESSREEKRVVAQALAWRDRCAEKTFGGFLSFWCQSWRTLNEEGPPTQFYVLWPEWPALPYLKIPARVRQKRLQLWTGRAFKQASKPKQLAWEMPALPLVGISYLFARREVFWQRAPWYKGPYEDAVVGQTITFTGKKHGLWKTREYVAFDIQWLESNERIVERFRQWVQKRRKQNGIEARESRGPASFTKELRASLTALGAWRLVKQYGLSFDKGHTYTEKLSGKALYANPETWRRNVNWVEDPY